MNFTPVLSAFQGAILSADNVHQFSRLSAIGGNEEQINYVITSLTRFLEEGEFISNGKIQNQAEVRKFALYIVLNADLPVLQQLVEMEAISTVIWTTPTIPKCLMCEIMWNLHMEQFISEIISFAHPQLALEVANAFLDNFKYFYPLNCLEQLKLLSTSCYLLICRLQFFNFESIEMTHKSTTALNNFNKCLKYYTVPPNNYKLNTLNKPDLYKYQGKSLYSLLQVMEECLNYFTKKLDMNTPGDDFYKITYAEESLKKDLPHLNDGSNNILLDCLNNSNVAMLDICKILVMDVSVDVFCCWSEIEENGKTMQQTVGELCYKVRNKLMSLTALAEHPVVSMFEQISRKPVGMRDKINAADEAMIEVNINKNNDESELWIKALIYREQLCQNMKLLNIVASNVDHYNKDESYILFSNLNKYASSNAENRDFVEALSVKVFENCFTVDKYTILEECFGNKTFTDMKETPEFETEITSIFNQLITSPEADCPQVFKIFLQSPEKFFTKVFVLACENTQQMEIMLKVMKLFEVFSDHYYSTDTEPCLIRIVQSRLDTGFDTHVMESNFVKFICGLKNEDIISGTKLFMLIIMTNMHKVLLNKEILDLKVQIKLLKEAYKLEELVPYRAPLLAMLAQVIDVVRWTINTFSTAAALVLDMTLDLLTSLLNTYNDGLVPENEKKWLKKRLISLQPLNMYYYRILWNPPGSNYLEIISGMTIQKNINLDVLTSWMTQVLCVCTRQEWCDLYDCLAVFGSLKTLKIFHDTTAKLFIAEKSNNIENSWACMFYVYRLFIYIIRFKFFKEPLTDAQVTTAVRRVATLTELVREENVEQFGTGLIPLLAFLIDKQNQYRINLIACLNECFGHTKLWPTINEMFANED